MNKNTSILLFAAVAGIMIAGALAVTMTNAAFAFTIVRGGNGGIGGAGGAGAGGNGGIIGAASGPPGLATATCLNPSVIENNPNC